MEIIVDSFAGGGGASTGIEMALGRSPDIAINHDATALAMHEVNHPQTLHLTEDVWNVDPLSATGGRPVGLAWFSPDCKHFSKAKGGKPVDKNIRGLAWVVVHWANVVAPRVIILENVEEFQTWGPLGPDNKPCSIRRGETFERWVGELRKLGYAVEWRELRACDYGAPTIRKRLFLIARRDSRPIVWPEPTHGDPKSDQVKQGLLLPWRTAAEIIDWSLPCPSIFATSEEIMAEYGLRAVRPLQPATMARIAKGVKRYVLDAAKPFIVRTDHASARRAGVHDVDDPARTVTAAGGLAVVAPLVSAAQQGGSSRDADEPLHTITASRKDQNQVIAPFLVPRYGERATQEPRSRSVERPAPVIVPTANGGSLVAPHLMTMRNAEKPFQGAGQPAHTVTSGGARMHLVAAFMAQHNYLEPGHDAREPVSTIVGKGSTQAVVSAGLAILKGEDRRDRNVEGPASAVLAEGNHVAETRAFLQKYYGVDQDPQLEEPLHTATTKDRFSLVTVEIDGEPYVITDIGMRMLTPRELFRAQGFPDSYVIDRRPDGKPISKTDQVSKCGNSVCPPIAAALVKANYVPQEAEPAPEFLEAAE